MNAATFSCQKPSDNTTPYTYTNLEMTLEQKVGQLIMAHFNGEMANKAARELIHEVGVGGIILYNFSNQLYSPQQVRFLNEGLQEISQSKSGCIPLLIAADQEGGIVARLNKGFTVFPGNKALGMTEDPELAEAAAFAIGEEMQAVGVNMNLAPVIDVNDNEKNPVIGIRSFASTAQTVTLFGEKALSGYRKSNTITCLKHFIGHGNTETDSHVSLPIVNKSKSELMEVELFPFYQLAHQADAIMTAHLIAPALDAEHCVTLSPTILQKLLREEMGFKGVVVSDSLVMEGVLKNCGGDIEEAAICALNAGCDLLILGGSQLVGSSLLELTTTDVKNIHGALVKAVQNGRISMQRVDEAFGRIIELKQRYALPQKIQKSIEQVIAIPEHLALAKTIAQKALRVLIQNTSFDPSCFLWKKTCLIAPRTLHTSIQEVFPINNGQTEIFFQGLNPDEMLLSLAQKHASINDLVIFFSYNAWKNASQEALIQSVINTGKPVIVIVTRDPLDATCFPGAARIIVTHSPTLPSLQAAKESLGI